MKELSDFEDIIRTLLEDEGQNLSNGFTTEIFTHLKQILVEEGKINLGALGTFLYQGKENSIPKKTFLPSSFLRQELNKNDQMPQQIVLPASPLQIIQENLEKNEIESEEPYNEEKPIGTTNEKDQEEEIDIENNRQLEIWNELTETPVVAIAEEIPPIVAIAEEEPPAVVTSEEVPSVVATSEEIPSVSAIAEEALPVSTKKKEVAAPVSTKKKETVTSVSTRKKEIVTPVASKKEALPPVSTEREVIVNKLQVQKTVSVINGLNDNPEPYVTKEAIPEQIIPKKPLVYIEAEEESVFSAKRIWYILLILLLLTGLGFGVYKYFPIFFG